MLPNTFETCGFVEYFDSYTKPDPRGDEYGRFKASRTNIGIMVWHSDDGYSMIFQTDEDFINWASYNT